MPGWSSQGEISKNLKYDKDNELYDYRKVTTHLFSFFFHLEHAKKILQQVEPVEVSDVFPGLFSLMTWRMSDHIHKEAVLLFLP